MISRATNGNDTKIVASTMPGTAKTMLMSWSVSHGPRHALAPEEQHEDQARDDRRNGKRQIDQREQQLLATKLELADRPGGADAEDKFAGTAMSAAVSVSVSAAIASGSPIAETYAPQP